MTDHNHQYGFCLLEVLIASSVLSLVLLSVFAIQCSILRQMQLNDRHQQAMIAMHNLAERLSVCVNNQCRSAIDEQWKNAFNISREKGASNLQCSNNRCKITVRWSADHLYKSVWLI